MHCVCSCRVSRPASRHHVCSGKFRRQSRRQHLSRQPAVLGAGAVGSLPFLGNVLCTRPPLAPQTLYSFPGDFRALKALIAAQVNGVAVETPEFDLATDGKSEAFLAKSPLGKVPLLETAKGACRAQRWLLTGQTPHCLGPVPAQAASTRATPSRATSPASVVTPSSWATLSSSR